MRRAHFAISAAFLALGGLTINLCCTHHICGVGWCRGCRVERVLGFDGTRFLTLTVCAETIQGQSSICFPISLNLVITLNVGKFFALLSLFS